MTTPICGACFREAVNYAEQKLRDSYPEFEFTLLVQARKDPDGRSLVPRGVTESTKHAKGCPHA